MPNKLATFISHSNSANQNIGAGVSKFSLGKRQRFIISVALLSGGLFITEYLFNSYGIIVSFLLGFCTDLCFLISMRKNIHEKPSTQSLFLPFLYSLSVSLFYFLTPARLLSRVILTTFYAIGLYSLFLSENIFTVSSIRTIALSNSARIVSFVISLVSYFFLTNTIFSFRFSIFPTSLLLFAQTFPFILHAIWTYTLDKSIKRDIIWSVILSICLFELGTILWFWPTSPTVVAIYLTGVFYILVGLSHAWLDKRLFRSVLWEYIWVAVVITIILVLFTTWQ